MSFSFIVLVILVFSPFSLASSLKNGGLVSPHIIGGYEVKPHSHPYQVLINIHRTNILLIEAQCGGSLISSEWVISAAHCNNDAVFIFAVLGAHDTNKNEPSQEMKIVTHFYKHPKYDPKNKDNDIALLQIAPSVVFKDEIQPIRLPSWSQKDTWFWRYPVITTGWGWDSYDPDKQAPTALQGLESTTTTNLYCKFRIGFSVIKDFHICIDGSGGKAPYKGDSGGPLVITEPDGKYTLIGITSRGVTNGTEKSYPTIFTRTTKYLEWISKTSGIPIRE